ncbi:MAG: glycosyltransferase [Clostridia bacterium]|nr:glycosyltransferase [Clostridia bacterium]
MTLGLSMIVKNESEVLERVLKNVLSFVDEIVIVDTGSTDGTIDIAKKYTDKVYTFEWNDDFSAARNFALSKVESDYWMWLDADDLVPEETAICIAEYMKNSNGMVDVIMLPYVVDRTEDGKPSFSYYRERIMKNHTDFVWQGCVHEVIQPQGEIVKFPYYIIHDKPKRRGNGMRNLNIYRKSIASGKILSAREKYYYARELFYNGFIAQAIEEFKSFLEMPDGFYVNKTDGCMMLARCYLQMNDSRSALDIAFHSFIYGLPTGEMCCLIGAIYYLLNDYKSAVYWYECATHIKPDLDSGAFIDFSAYDFTPYIWLTVCYDKLGDRQKAYQYHCHTLKLYPKHPSVIINQAYFESLGYN